jgi:DNA polymerase-3 subunit epsilon
MAILFFDTETTGLPSGKIPFNHPDQPAILQLGALLMTEDGEELDSIATLVKIGSKAIHPMAQAAHGISAERANLEGITPVSALLSFHKMILDADMIVCHNFEFDFKLIKILAHSLATETKDESILMLDEIEQVPYKCTMRATIQFCALPFPSGRKGCKFPKLEELHMILFNKKFADAHDAMADVSATARCYFELVSRGIM